MKWMALHIEERSVPEERRRPFVSEHEVEPHRKRCTGGTDKRRGGRREVETGVVLGLLGRFKGLSGPERRERYSEEKVQITTRALCSRTKKKSKRIAKFGTARKNGTKRV